jgi:lipoprotein NlpD
MAASCASPRPAPVVERAPPARASAPAPVPAPIAKPAAPRPSDTRPEFYVVKPGDTLYSIALEQGLDYRELAIWNGIDHPGALRLGQQLRLTAPSGAAVAAPLKSAPGTVDAKPLAAGPSAASPPVAAAPAPPTSGAMVSEPKGVRLPYSEQALAQLAKPETPAPARVEAPPVRAEASRPDTRPETGGETARGPDDLDWGWPVKGKLIGTFSEGSNKGIAIAGKLGQPVVATAPGRVIFSGTGIRGFGKLIVIKHNNTYLSVYAHNNELTVKEGQTVAKGQKIAEMGSTDADQVKLHFEIRRFGKPVDPLKLLPAG